MRKIPARYAHIVFAFLLSLIMSFIVSAISIIKSSGLESFILGNWMQAWGTSWLVAFPCVLLIAPFVRKLVGKLTG